MQESTEGATAGKEKVTPATLVEILRRYRIQGNCEASVQVAILRAFEAEHVTYVRECDLGVGVGRIDFFCSGVGVEVKTRGSRNDVLRQLKRYADCDLIDGLVLVTTRNSLRAMPESLNGKPVLTVYVGVWL